MANEVMIQREKRYRKKGIRITIKNKWKIIFVEKVYERT